MQPFWAGTQRAGDALGLVVYRGRDLAAAEVFHVQSHFVLRRTADIWLDGKRLTMPVGTAVKAAEVPIPAGASLVLRYGSAAVGVRVPWTFARGKKLPSPVLGSGDMGRGDRSKLKLPSPVLGRGAGGEGGLQSGAAKIGSIAPPADPLPMITKSG
jgi:hypothetical protein